MDEKHDKPAKELEGEAPSQDLSIWGAAWRGAVLAHPTAVIIVFLWGAVFGCVKPQLMFPNGHDVYFGFEGGCNALGHLLFLYLCLGFGLVVVSILGAVSGVFLNWLWRRSHATDLPVLRWEVAAIAYLLLGLVLFGFWRLQLPERGSRGPIDTIGPHDPPPPIRSPPPTPKPATSRRR